VLLSDAELTTLNKTMMALAVMLGVAVLPAPAAEPKIGVVNAQKVLEKAPQAEAARKRLEAEFAPRDKELAEMQKEMRKNEERMEKDGMVMSEAERQKLDREIVSQKRELKRAQEEFRDDLNLRRNEEFGKLQKRIAEVILAVAKENNYDLVLTDGVLYASDKVDITETVLTRLNASEKDAAPAKSGAKTPAN
jgi:outer membrane protein